MFITVTISSPQPVPRLTENYTKYLFSVLDLTSLNRRNSLVLCNAGVGSRYCSHVPHPPTTDNLATGAGCQNKACEEGSSRQNPASPTA